MGTSATPHVTYIYLLAYEFKYFTQLYEDNRKDNLARLEHTFRYQDDLLAINDDGLLEPVVSDIYPPEMIVNHGAGKRDHRFLLLAFPTDSVQQT